VSRHHEFFNSVVFKSAPTQQKARLLRVAGDRNDSVESVDLMVYYAVIVAVYPESVGGAGTCRRS
jgi:hypothetical protein